MCLLWHTRLRKSFLSVTFPFKSTSLKLRWLLEQGHSHYLRLQGDGNYYTNNHNELFCHKKAGGVYRFLNKITI